jgi:hypothetical protein
VDAFIFYKGIWLDSSLFQLHNPSAIICLSLSDFSFIILQVVGQIGMGLHVRLYVPRKKSTAKEWCSVVQNLAATVLLD